MQSAQAETWRGVQGQVLHVAVSLAETKVRAFCFDQAWPVERDHGKVHAWIGIDLAQKPGTYAISWRNQEGNIVRKDVLKVEAGHFTVSRIQVPKKMAEFDPQTLQRIRQDHAHLRRAYAAKVKMAQPIAMLLMPVDGEVSTPFGAKRIVNGHPRSPHAGVDLAAPEGTPIRAPLAGKVVLAEEMFLNGKTVVLAHGRGLISVYSHMQAMNVKEGQKVRTGEVIGFIGKSGRATGPHLHWGVRLGQARVDPLTLLVRDR